MAMAAGARQGEPEPDGCGRIDAVHHILDRVFLGDDPPFSIAAMVAVEARRNPLLQRRPRQHVARELLDRELVKRHVPVICIDYPVAPSPHHARRIGLIPVRIRVSGRAQPSGRHPFSESRRGQQPIDHLLVGDRAFIPFELVELLGGRGEPREIQRHPSEQDPALRLA